MATEEKTKVCKCCGKELPLSEFYISLTGKNGRKAACKKCESEKQMARYARLKEESISKSVTKEKTKVRECCGNSELETKDILEIADFSDSMLVAELRRRGYTGELRFSKTVAI